MLSPDRYYVSEDGWRALMGWYEAALAGLPVAHEVRYVPTRYGLTHVMVVGDPLMPPVMLVHGTNVNALGWKQLLIALAGRYRVYAPDVIGFAGRSAPVRLPYGGSAYGDWMADVLDGLEIERAALIGSSGGGFFALKAAAYHPERVAGVVLMNPCGLIGFRQPGDLIRQPVVNGVVNWLARRVLAWPRVARWMVRYSASASAPLDEEIVGLSYVLLRYYKRHYPPGPLTDGELARVGCPVLLLVSEEEPFFWPGALLRAGERRLRRVSARLVCGAGHDMHRDQPEQTVQAIMGFVDGLEDWEVGGTF